MIMNYCGRCGSSNGPSARFCRQCGAELSSQTAYSSHSTPLNVEFSSRTATKEPETETIPASPESNQLVIAEHTGTELSSEKDESISDPVSISKSLRHIRRTSGPLIIEASKKDHEEMNKIITLAVEGFEKNSDEPDEANQSDITPPQLIVPVEPPVPTPSQTQSPTQSKIQQRQLPPHALPEPLLPPADPPAPPAPVAPAASAAPGATISTRSAPRRTRGSIMPSGLLSKSGPLTSGGQTPPNGPSTVLAQASGLNPKPSYGTKFFVAVVMLATFLGIGIYYTVLPLIYHQAPVGDRGRDLVSVEDQSAQYIRLGERDRDQGQYDSAMENFQRAVNLTPNNTNLRYLIAQTFSNTGQTDEALKAYKVVLRISPEHLEARLQVAQIYQARGNWNAAYQEYKRIIALDQNSVQAGIALEAIEAQEDGKSPPPATSGKEQPQQKTASSATVLPKGYLDQAQISVLPQKLGPAPSIRLPDSMNSNKPDENPDPRALADSRKKLGLRYLHIREYPAAITELLAALRLTPDDKDIYYFLGSAYFGLGQYARAHDYYKRVDRGQYLQVARAGAQKTEKAAREDVKRRNELLKNEIKNQVKKEAEDKQPSGTSFLDMFK
jgi:tetratricopeptide (TPR) repeat protein